MQHDFHPSQEGPLKVSQQIFSASQDNKIIFHCYWYGTFGRMQAMSIKSLLATQKNYDYEIWLWLDSEAPDSDSNNEDNIYLNQIRDYVTIKPFNPDTITNQTKNLAFRADDFRIWTLHEYGGLYFDLDVMFLRDMINLLMGSEFVYAWGNQTYANSAVIYLRRGSPVNEYIFRKTASRKAAQPWVLFNYSDKNLVGLKLYSCSLFDAIWNCEKGDYIFDTFDGFFTANNNISQQKISSPAEIFPYSYCYHWHNHWKVEIEHASPFEFCEKFFDEAIKISLQ